LAQELHKLDRFDLLFLDDISYVRRDQDLNVGTSQLRQIYHSRSGAKSSPTS
jgi:DNA replication protein DnaC